jgi:protein-L-isoaspartate O-methyltransferase
MNDTDIQKYQQELVEYLKKANYLKTPLVEEAFMKVPRHLFLPDEPLDKVYSDVAIVRKRVRKVNGLAHHPCRRSWLLCWSS